MKKINVRSVSDILSDKQLKKVFGGYGNGPGGWSECCQVAYTYYWSDGAAPGGGVDWFCGSAGVSDCGHAVLQWSLNQCNMFFGLLERLTFWSPDPGCPTYYNC